MMIDDRTIVQDRTPPSGMTARQAYDALKRHPDLPSPKGVALEVLRLARSPKRSLSELARAIEADPAITSRVIKLVNSSAFPHNRPIVSLTEAIAYLGTRTVEGVALGFSLVSIRGRCKAFDYVRFWSESLGRAVAACRLAQHLTADVPDELFTVGLLAQLGRLVFACTYPERYDTLLTSIQCGPSEFKQLERELFAIDHDDLTSRLMRDWGLPELVCEAVLLQDGARGTEFREGSEAERLATVLSLASRVSEHIVAGSRGDKRPDDLLAEASRLGLDCTGLAELIGQVIPFWREMVGIFALNEMVDIDIQVMYAEAAALNRAITAR